MGHGVGVVGPVHEIRTTRFVGDGGGRRRCQYDDLVPLPRHVHDRERGGRGRHVENRIDRAPIEPFARLRRRDIGLVLVIGKDELDWTAEHLPSEIVDGHLGGGDAAGPSDVGIDTRHVEQEAEPDHLVGDAAGRRGVGRRHDADHNRQRPRRCPPPGRHGISRPVVVLGVRNRSKDPPAVNETTHSEVVFGRPVLYHPSRG